MKISEAVADSNKRNESRQLMSIALPLMMGLALEQLIGMTDVLFSDVTAKRSLLPPA